MCFRSLQTKKRTDNRDAATSMDAVEDFGGDWHLATHSDTAAVVGLRFLPSCLHSVLRSLCRLRLDRRTQGQAEAQAQAKGKFQTRALA